jgi:serine/threonine protein kinase
MERYLGPGRMTSNGLHFIICRMRHRHLPGCYGRGKFYHLSYLNDAARASLRTKLTRHAEVCHRIGPHLHIAANLSTTPVANEEGWWIIDRWVSADSLATHLERGPWPREKLPRLMHEIALGLEALHRAEIVLRELAPSRVLIDDDDGRAVLSEFELAKLLDDAGPSVATDWPEDRYRAPEVEDGNATVQADLFSWARVFLHAASGNLPDTEEPEPAIGDLSLPKGLRNVLVDCLSPVPADRPNSLAPVLKELSRS